MTEIALTDVQRAANKLANQEIDWEQRRYEISVSAMQGVMNFFGSIDYNKETIAKLAVEQADALIKELKRSKLWNQKI